MIIHVRVHVRILVYLNTCTCMYIHDIVHVYLERTVFLDDDVARFQILQGKEKHYSKLTLMLAVINNYYMIVHVQYMWVANGTLKYGHFL